MKIPLVFVLISFSIELVAVYGKPELSADLPIPETIDALQKRIASFQAQEDRNYTPPITWATSKGAYQSDIHLNWQGSPFLALARDNLACYDTNSFSSIWITTVLIEAYKYGVAPRPNDDQMMLALDAISAFHNKNNPAGDGDMNFWLQIYNKTSDMWISHPENVYEGVEFIHKYTPFRLLESILKYFDWEAGLEILDFFKSAEAYFSAFLIPSDFDDTYLNIGMGAILKNCQKDFPTLYNTWSKQNTNYQTAFQDLKKFAYRPMSEELDENAIDTRTYYYLRGFLQEAKENSQSVSLITTWVQNIAEERYLSYEGVSMPFHINNVDTTVAANSIYGLTSAVLYDLSSDSSWFDNDIQAIYANSTSLIVWLINHNVIEERPDLALTYYPSRYSFYYYVARTLFILETKYANDGELPFEVLDQMRMNLKRALQGKVSKMIQSEAILDYDDMIFFEEFIGNGDTDLSGQPLKRGEDRLFSTSMVINFYIATWTTQNKATGKLDWAEETPDYVTRLVDGAVEGLNRFILKNTYKTYGAFFSGSVKGNGTIPYYYPANHIESLNGTILPKNTTINYNMFVAVSGVIDEDEYNELLTQPHFGKMTPTNFTGYNDKEAFFPFWSSDAYTYANSLLALAQFLNLN